jgi:hypothetical protein
VGVIYAEMNNIKHYSSLHGVNLDLLEVWIELIKFEGKEVYYKLLIHYWDEEWVIFKRILTSKDLVILNTFLEHKKEDLINLYQILRGGLIKNSLTVGLGVYVTVRNIILPSADFIPPTTIKELTLFVVLMVIISGPILTYQYLDLYSLFQTALFLKEHMDSQEIEKFSQYIKLINKT